MHYLIARLVAGVKVYGYSKQKSVCEREMKKRIERTPEHVCPRFLIVDEAHLNKIKAEEAAERKAKATAGRKRGAQKAKETIARRGKHFILCPTCQSKSKLLFSEMGGLQTRRCKKGHNFEVDTFFGFETNKRRVERTDRPVYVMAADGGPGNYVDYIEGRYKNDPEGKQDR